jgi:hypothetical protein
MELGHAQSLSYPSMLAVIERLHRGIGRYGFVGCVCRGALLAEQWLSRLAYLDQRHIWYQLDLSHERSLSMLPAELELVRASTDELSLLEQLPTIGLFEAHRRLVSGADLWIVRKGQQAVFSCWTFHDRMPVFAAHGGWLELPKNIVGLEDSVKSPAYRGRAIAPGAWSTIADVLAHEGVTGILTKIEESNLTCRRSIEKVGFRAVASMRLVQILARAHVRIQPTVECDTSAFLVTHLVH